MRHGKIRCEICGAERRVKPSHVAFTKYCSRACRLQGRRADAIARWEARIGEPIGPWLKRRYEVEKATYREMMADLGLNEVRTMASIMRANGIRPRGKSESVRGQWERDSGARRRDRKVGMRAVGRTFGGKYLYGRDPSPRELVLKSWLEERGVSLVSQQEIQYRQEIAPRTRSKPHARVFRCHVDLFAPKLQAAIEVYGNKSLLNAVRYYGLRKLGLRIFYFPNRFVDRKQLDRVDLLATALKAKADPSAVGMDYPEDAPRN